MTKNIKLEKNINVWWRALVIFVVVAVNVFRMSDLRWVD